MIKIINKLCYYIKNILLPIVFFATLYILGFMFQRLNKQVFGANFLEFVQVALPFVILIILLIVNTLLKHYNVKNCFFYNFTSFLVMLTIFFFCYRALFDKNMYMWHKYTYKINFNYFSDQIGPIKVMLYMLSFANVVLIIEEYLKKTPKKKDDFKDKKEFKEEINKKKLDFYE